MFTLSINQIITSFDKGSLADVGIKNVELWIELVNVYGDSTFKKFSDVLSHNMMLIEWLREVTPGMNGIM